MGRGEKLFRQGCQEGHSGEVGARGQSPNDEKKWAHTPPTTHAFRLSVLKTGGFRDSV